MRKLLLFAFALLLSGSMMAQFNVTMVVDMSTADGFDPATNAVYVSGSLWGWPEPGTNTDLQLMQSDTNDMVFYITAEVAEATEIQYKYASDFAATGWDGAEWAGDPNRVIYPTGEATVMDTWADAPVVVTFNVDMTNVDGFDPATNTVTMAGTINIASNWQEPGNDSSLMMSPSEGNNMIWTLSKYLYTGNTYQYKYFSDVIGDGWNGGEWEGDPNREVMISADTTLNDIWASMSAINDPEAGPITSIYPNPCTSTLNITFFENSNDITKIEIYNIIGEVVETIEEVNTQAVSINTNKLVNGVYIVAVHNSKGVQTTKFVKE